MYWNAGQNCSLVLKPKEGCSKYPDARQSPWRKNNWVKITDEYPYSRTNQLVISSKLEELNLWCLILNRHFVQFTGSKWSFRLLGTLIFCLTPFWLICLHCFNKALANLRNIFPSWHGAAFSVWYHIQQLWVVHISCLYENWLILM